MAETEGNIESGSILDRASDEDREGLNLIANIMSASLGATFDASNRVTEAVEKQRNTYARLLVELWEAVNAAAEQSTSRRLERVLETYAGVVDDAQRYAYKYED